MKKGWQVIYQGHAFLRQAQDRLSQLSMTIEEESPRPPLQGGGKDRYARPSLGRRGWEGLISTSSIRFLGNQLPASLLAVNLKK